MEEIIESYINGNILHARKKLMESKFGLGDLLESYIRLYDPSSKEIVSFVKLLGW